MRVSVLINNYNYGRYLDHCLRSVFRQSRLPDEVILYDDGSPDDSLQVLRRWQDRLTVIARENYGKLPGFNQANAINQAFAESTGDVICLLDSDDAFLPGKIEAVCRAFAADADTVLVQHPFREIDADGTATGVQRPKLKRVDPARYIERTHNLSGLFTQTSGLSFRRSLLETLLPLPEDGFDTIWPDVRLTRHALFFGRIQSLRSPLGEYRVHGGNDSRKLQDKTYLRRHLRQHYDYYNQCARQHGRPEISPDRCIICPLTGAMASARSLTHKAWLALTAPEPMSIKASILLEWIFKPAHRRT